MKLFLKIFIGICLLITKPIFAQTMHLFTVGNSNKNQVFVDLAKQIPNYSTNHQTISSGTELIESLLNTEWTNQDILFLAYSGQVVRNNYFEIDGLTFNHARIQNMLDSANIKLVITAFNTDLSDKKLSLSYNTIKRIFSETGKVNVLCHNLETLSQHLEKSTWKDSNTHDLWIESKLISIYAKSPSGSSDKHNKEDLVPFTVLKPTARKDIPKHTLKNCKNLGDVNTILRKALKEARYKEHRYYGMPNGFALVARMEKIDGDGSPYKEPERWQIGVQLNNPFDYLKAMFTAPKGYYRVIAFIVTDELFNSNTPATEQKVNAWFSSKRKIIELPSDVAAFPYKKDRLQQVVAFIYEFKTGDIGEKPTLLTEGNGSPKSAVEHLDAAGLWQTLNSK